jgi:CelD/BcsL family acetyltransferase involved in cellulose biosynthesis
MRASAARKRRGARAFRVAHSADFAMIRIQEIRDWSSLEPHAQAWNELVRESDTATIFQCFEWHQAWWRVFRGEYELRALLAWSADRLVGVAPWVLNRESSTLQFLGSGDEASDYCDLLVDARHPQAVDEFARWLLDHSSEWLRLDLRNLPGHSQHRARREARLPACSRWLYTEVSADAPTRLLGNPGADAELLGKASLKRHVNHFRKSGRLEFAQLSTEQEILPWLDAFFRQHVERRALAGKTSQFLDSRQRQLYRELARTLGPTGWLRFAVVRFNDAPIAFHFGFEHKSRFVWYKPTFSAEHAKRSPGEVLLKLLFEYAVSAKLQEFDFTVGNEAFKYRFANHVRRNHRLRLFSNPLEYWLLRTKKAAKQLLRRSEAPALARYS